MRKSKINMTNTFRFGGINGHILLRKVIDFLVAREVDFIVRTKEKGTWELNCQRNYTE